MAAPRIEEGGSERGDGGGFRGARARCSVSVQGARCRVYEYDRNLSVWYRVGRPFNFLGHQVVSYLIAIS